MANLLQRLTAPAEAERSILSIDDYALALSQYTTQLSLNSSYGRELQTEKVGGDFQALSLGAFQRNGVVFACMAVRQLVFSSVRFRYQRLRDGKPSDSFGSPALRLLETPAPGETTQDFLSRMIQDADLAGNHYAIESTPLPRIGGDGGTQIIRLRPDWVDIATVPLMYSDPDQRGIIGRGKYAYVYTEGGHNSGNDPVVLDPRDVEHFAPIPDPLANFRGMSWLTPVVREIENDSLMSQHKRRFFEKGGTPNLIVKHAESASKEAVLEWAKRVNAGAGQIDNAYKTLNLYPGADATVVGSNMKEVDFKAIQGAGETRIAAAAGVPPIIVGLSEGLESATYSNYAQARRRFADGTMHPLWQNAAGSLAQIMPSMGADTRLWYDADDIPFLREDEKDAAEINQTRATTISSLITSGYEPDSVVLAVDTGDFRLLKHTGLYSVQLQAPGSTTPAIPAAAPGGDA